MLFAVGLSIAIVGIGCLVCSLVAYCYYRTQQTSKKNHINIKFKDVLTYRCIAPYRWHCGYYRNECWNKDVYASIWYTSEQKGIFHTVFSYFDWIWFHMWNIYNTYSEYKRQNKNNTVEFLQSCQKDIDRKRQEAQKQIVKGKQITDTVHDNFLDEKVVNYLKLHRNPALAVQTVAKDLGCSIEELNQSIVRLVNTTCGGMLS